MSEGGGREAASEGGTGREGARRMKFVSGAKSNI